MATYTRTTRQAAKAAYDKGATNIAIQSSKMAPDGVWSQACRIDNSNDYAFDAVIVNFKWYNCDAERGNGVHFYKVED